MYYKAILISIDINNIIKYTLQIIPTSPME